MFLDYPLNQLWVEISPPVKINSFG